MGSVVGGCRGGREGGGGGGGVKKEGCASVCCSCSVC